MTKTLKVDVFTDPVCPWCLVGSVRLDKALAALPADVSVDVENHPFYLDPKRPPNGVDVPAMLRLKYGRDPHEIWARAEAEAARSGIALDLAKQPRAYPTEKAQTLTRLARPLGTQHALANALASAYFLEQRQIHEDDTLAEIGGRFGFTRDDVLDIVHDQRELRRTHDLAMQAARQGLDGVPHFVFAGIYAFSGCRPAPMFERAIAMALGEPARPTLLAAG